MYILSKTQIFFFKKKFFFFKQKNNQLLLIIAISIVVKGVLANETVNYGTNMN